MIRKIIFSTAFPLLVACGAKTEPAAPMPAEVPATKPAQPAPVLAEPAIVQPPVVAEPVVAEPVVAEVPVAPSYFAGFDPKAEIALLNGKWAVNTRPGQETPGTWIIKDGAVTMIDGETTVQGTLQADWPGEIKIMTPNNGQTVSETYSFTHDGDSFYIGLGKGGLKVGDIYYAYVMGGVVAFDGTSCKFHKEEGGTFDKPTTFREYGEQVCSVEGTTFKFQAPQFAKEEVTEDFTLEIMGTALISEDLKGFKIERIITE